MSGKKKFGKRKNNNPFYSKNKKNENNNDSMEVESRQKHGANQQTITLKITGYPQSTIRKDILNFLTEQVSFKYKKFIFTQSESFLVLYNNNDADALKSLTGIVFRKNKLTIGLATGRSTSSTVSSTAVNSIDNNIEKYFNQELKVLDLSNMNTKNFDEYDGTNPKYFEILFTKIKLKFKEPVETLIMSGNQINSFQVLHSLSRHLNRVINLSLDQNEIADISQISVLKHLRLRDFTMQNNPVLQTIPENDILKTVLTNFPTLEYFNCKQIQKKPLNLPKMKSHWFGEPNNEAMVANFVQKYFTAFDNDRVSLYDAYGQNSFFSQSLHNYCTTKSSRNFNRNILYIDNPEKIKSTIAHGVVDVMQRITKDIPKTVHQINEFLVDSQVINTHAYQNQMLSIIVHGTFMIAETNEKRSFDRTFILTPIASKAFPVTIINDQLHIRPENPIVFDFASDPKPQVAVQEAAITPERQVIIEQLAAATGMNHGFTKLLLEQSGWDANAAFSNFQTARDRIPPEAFVKN